MMTEYAAFDEGIEEWGLLRSSLKSVDLRNTETYWQLLEGVVVTGSKLLMAKSNVHHPNGNPALQRSLDYVNHVLTDIRKLSVEELEITDLERLRNLVMDYYDDLERHCADRPAQGTDI